MPKYSFANGTADLVLGTALLLILVGPYFMFALIPYFIQRRYKGKSIFFSTLTYVLCIAGVILAYYQQFRFIIPNYLSADDVIFFIRALPLITVMILAANKAYRHRKQMN